MSAPEESWRLFVALDLPAEVKARLAQVQSHIRSVLPSGGASWTRPENLHLTLRFLGQVSKDRCGQLLRVLSAVAEKCPPLELRAARLGCFPDLRRPRILWAGVHDDREVLGRLQREVESATAPFTSEPAEEKFTGHVTLGRIKRLRPADLKRVREIVGSHATQDFGQWQAAGFLLLRSDATPEGSRYTGLGELALRADGQPAA